METTAQPSLVTPHFIGRSNHLATLRLHVEQARHNKGQLVLISGEAGIGKTRLLSEIKSCSSDVLWLQGNCFPTDLTYPYAPFLDLLRSLFASHPSEPLATKLERLAYDLFPLLPELVLEQIPPPLPLEPEQEKHRLFALLTNFFIYLSSTKPLLLVIEDIHWCDAVSLDLLHMLARRTSLHPFLLLVTYRQDEVHPSLSNWLAQLTRERQAITIQLTPLSRTNVDLMLSAFFEPRRTTREMRRFLHGELLDTLYTLTDGNPFFVEETLSGMIAAGDISYDKGYWNGQVLSITRVPQNIQDTVQQRMIRLGEAANQVLTLAAVAGRHFDFTLLQQLTSYDEPYLLLIMKELVAVGLVVEESSEQFAFRHALTRQAIYTRLLARERANIHRTIADMLEQQHATAPDGYLETLANHFYQGKCWPKAVEYAQRAGKKALQLYAHRAAIDYFTWAITANEHLSRAPQPALHRARGQAYEMLGEFERARQDYIRALQANQAQNNHTGVWQSTIDLGCLWTGRDYVQAEVWFRQAFALSQSFADPILHAHSLNRLGNWHLNIEQPREALQYHQEALTIFQHAQDTHGIAETLDLLGMTSYLGGDLIGGTAYYYQAIEHFRALNDRAGLASSLATLALRGPTFQTDALLAATSLAEARQSAEQALELARAIGQRSAEIYALFQLGLCLGSQGEYSQAVATTQQSLTLAEEIEHRQWQSAAHTVLGSIYNSQLAYTRAREHIEQALVLARDSGSLFWTRIATGYLASVMIQLRDLTRAETILHEHQNTPATQTMAQSLITCASVELALAQEKPLLALEQLDQLMSPPPGREQGLRLLMLRGMTLIALQRFTEAEVVLRQAQTLSQILGTRPMSWRICSTLSTLVQSEEAESWRASARATIEELAATLNDAKELHDQFLSQAEAQLPDTPSSEHAPKHTSGGLTAREREVALLIAQGKSNQAIADILVITKRTVETHVGNIMFKLGCTSRTQIAVRVVETKLASNIPRNSP